MFYQNAQICKEYIKPFYCIGVPWHTKEFNRFCFQKHKKGISYGIIVEPNSSSQMFFNIKIWW